MAEQPTPYGGLAETLSAADLTALLTPEPPVYLFLSDKIQRAFRTAWERSHGLSFDTLNEDGQQDQFTAFWLWLIEQQS